jgi:hypothetical protein
MGIQFDPSIGTEKPGIKKLKATGQAEERIRHRCG